MSQLSRRSLLRAGAATVVASVLASCADPAAGTDDAPAPAGVEPSGELRLLFQGQAADRGSWEKIFAEFHKKYPKVRTTAINAPGTSWADFFTAVQIRLAGGQDFDILYLPTEGQRLFAKKNLVQSIDAWIERDRAEIDDFLADADPRLVTAARRTSSPNQHTYYLPYGFNTMAIWYRRSLFRSAGIPEPADNWRWKDVRAAAERLTRPGQRYGIHMDPGYFVGFAPWLLTNGADVLNRAWTVSTVDSPAAIAATTFARGMVRDRLSPTPGGAYDVFDQFAKGKLAMFGAGRWPIPKMRDAGIVDDIGIVPWPRQKQLGSPVGWGSIPILRKSKNKEAAWAFVKFLLTRPIQELIGREAVAGILPARRSTAKGPVTGENSPIGTSKMYDALAYATPVASPDRQNLVQQGVEEAYTQILTGAVTPERKLADLNKTIEDALKR
ncbi:ABC transporter substrate-binding protein [Fodinicola acaciae]|uniref:ABC transporter substrate-binding protein n=1 Tax=Fodinicola acaciae TaxID=2681555 RepID=UPI0013CF5A7E|nr:sugar ABC transporter substrate-binding protein [Fodinicola acaciae]